MQAIHLFFQINQPVIYFLYGLVFFVLGLSITLQSRASSRLEIARSLPWLAAFGFTHGFYEWGDLFIPIQSSYLAAGVVEFLSRVHLLLLAVSFALLFEFGISLLRPLRRASWLYGISSVLLAVWIFIVYYPLPLWIPDFGAWHAAANALARYFIGFPAALAAGYGLRVHTFKRIAALNAPHILRMLRTAGILLGVYGILAGLVPPPVGFFPGSWLNSVSFEAALLAPPALYRSLIGLALAVAFIRALEIFDVEAERQVESMEQQQILSAERDRIGREMHDGAIQKVYTAGLLVESSARLVEADHPVLRERLEKAVVVLNDAIHDLRESLGELRAPASQGTLAEGLKRLAGDPRFHSLVEVDLSLDLPGGEQLTRVRTDHVLALTGEALSNIIRHAHARHVHISAKMQDGRFLLRVEDDGDPIPAGYTPGFGLRNMRDRARLLGGELVVTPGESRGTQVSLDIPWKDEIV